LQLALHKTHAAAGARFFRDGDFELPAHYGDPLREYRAIRRGLALADLSYQGLWRVTGDDHTTFLKGLISNDLPKAESHLGTRACLLTAKGKILSDFFLYPLFEGLLMELEYGNAEKTKADFMRFRLRSKVEMKSPGWGRVLVSGPNAQQFLEEYLGEKLAVLGEKSVYEKEINGERIICIKRSMTGETDFHLYIANEGLESLWESLMSHGAEWEIQPVGQDALEICRVEAGKPRYGIDMNEETIPVEAGIQGEVISYTKGCFPGQEVIARLKTYGHVNRQLSGLILDGETLPKPGAAVFQGEKTVGWLCSVVRSPFVGKIIAMGYLRREVLSPGTALTVPVDSKQQDAETTALPFYSQSSKS